MDTGTQTAEEKIIDAEFTEETGLQVHKQHAALSVRHEISPEQFKAEIENRKALKGILLGYVRDELKEGHHFYYASKFGKDVSTQPKPGEKPSLNKEGALNVCHTLRCFPGKTDFEIIRHDDGHVTVYADANIYNADGVLIATGRGSCSSHESKYRYRWVYDRDVPRDLDKNLLQMRSGSNWKQYRIENPDIADLENTIIKMADKRAMKGAVDKLPIVSDIFAPGPIPEDLPIEEPVTETPTAARPSATNQTRPAQQTASSPAEQGTSSPAESWTRGSVKTAVDLSTKLQKDHNVDFESLAVQFLPEGCDMFSKLTEDQAAAIVPGLAELLNAKVGGS